MSDFGIGGETVCGKTDSIQMSKDSKEYLVEGAKIACVNGTEMQELLVPAGHSYTSGGKKKGNCKDSKQVVNIPYFGECSKNEDTHKCEGYMELEEKWENTSTSSAKPESVDGEDAISLSSVLLCKKGGVILPLTSGQGYEKGIDWGAYMRRYQNVFKWAVGKNLACHIYGKDPINMNTGNYIYEKEDLIIQGLMPLSFKLFYNTMSSRNIGSLGEGWTHNYEVRLIKRAQEILVAVVLEDGRELPYQQGIQGNYTPLLGDCGFLKKTSEGFYYRNEDGLCYHFNKDGQLLRQEDQNCNLRTLSYNPNGCLESVHSSNGGALYYTYNEDKYLISVSDHTGREVILRYQYGKLRWFTNAAGYEYTYEYNENEKLCSVVTPLGIQGVYNENDGGNRTLKQTMPDGGIVELRYDDKNRRTYMKEQNGNLIIYENDERCRNVKTIYEDGEEVYGYNDKNQKTLFIDKKGNKTKYAYDDRGNLTQILNALKQKTSMTYDAGNHLTSLKQPDGGCIKFHYDSRGNLIEKIEQSGYSTKLIYSKNGLVEIILQPDNSVIHLSYDECGNVVCVEDGTGKKECYEYDKLNRAIVHIDGNENRTCYQYNAMNSIIEILNAAGKKRQYEYNESGKISIIIDFDGGIQKFGYDESNRLAQYTDQEGNVSQFTYNKMGGIEEVKEASGGKTLYKYNHLNNLCQITNALGGNVMAKYDANGNIIHVTNSKGEELAFTYDSLNRNTTISEDDGSVTHFFYNESGQVSEKIDALGNKTKYEYDHMGRKIRQVYALNNEIIWSYNCLGKLISITDFYEQTISLDYQKGGLLKKFIYPNGTFEIYHYDKNNNLIFKENQSGYGITYIYDNLNQIIEVCSNFEQRKKYVYNDMGKVASFIDANGKETKFSYSLTGNLIYVQDPMGNVGKYDYDSIGDLISINNITVIICNPRIISKKYIREIF